MRKIEKMRDIEITKNKMYVKETIISTLIMLTYFGGLVWVGFNI